MCRCRVVDLIEVIHISTCILKRKKKQKRKGNNSNSLLISIQYKPKGTLVLSVVMAAICDTE
jgi:hypothetical protein